MLRLIGVALVALPIGSSIALAEELKLPPLKKQPSPQAVIDEHMDALNKCDWNRIMAQYPSDYQLNLPDGVVVKGREEAGKLFANFVKPADQGGLCGIKFTYRLLSLGKPLIFNGRLKPNFSPNRTKVPMPMRPRMAHGGHGQHLQGG